MGRKVDAQLQSNSPYIRAVNEYVTCNKKFDTKDIPFLDLSSKVIENHLNIEQLHWKYFITDQLV